MTHKRQLSPKQQKAIQNFHDGGAKSQMAPAVGAVPTNDAKRL